MLTSAEYINPLGGGDADIANRSATDAALLTPMLVPSDGMYSQQWHLNGTWGINVPIAWDSVTGKNVRVAVYDDGIDWLHPDLASRVEQWLSYYTFDRSPGGLPIFSHITAGGSPSDSHGTAVAGLIAGARNNSGVVGVAFDATLVSLYQNYEYGLSDTPFAFWWSGQIADVMNNSWGLSPFNHFVDSFTPYGSAGEAYVLAGAELAGAATWGRNGLGTVVVFSAGNARDSRSGIDNTNYHNLQNDRHEITVAASTRNGEITSYSTPGASILVTAPGGNGDIVTTDRLYGAGYDFGNYDLSFGGTSAAAPIVSGVVALMLEANPWLAYRDVQEILAYTARQTANTTIYEYNGARNWNGAGLHFSEDAGAGLVDARAAVRLAETWGAVHTAHNEALVYMYAAPDQGIADAGTSRFAFFNDTPLEIDHVQLLVDIGHERLSDLTITLTSPSGVNSVLANRPSYYSGNQLFWTFDSTHFWGEDGAGTWVLAITDNRGFGVGWLYQWDLRLYGDPVATDDNYIYTDEFNEMFSRDPAHAAQRATLDDIDGGTDLFNGAALSSNAVIRLDGTSSLIDGRSMTIANNVIENAYGGDGDDTMIGSAAANILYAARGNDRMEGAGGVDTVSGGAGNDTLYGGSGNDDLWGGAGNDTFYGGTESDTLRGGAGNDLYRIESGTDMVDEMSPGSGGTDTILLGTTDSFKMPAGIEVTLVEGNAIFYRGTSSDDNRSGANATNDRLDGAGVNDVLIGLGGSDALYGGSGNDRLDGGNGDDRFYGGLGNDVYVIDSPNDSVFESRLETLYAQDSTTGALWSWSASVNGLETQTPVARPGAGWLLAGRGDFNASTTSSVATAAPTC